MPIKTTDELVQGVRVVHLSGSWTSGPDDDPLRAQHAAWLQAGDTRFVFDMTGLELLNSIGLGRLVTYFTSTAREGGRMALAGLSDRNRRAAYVARILDLFEEFDDVDAAVAVLASTTLDD